MIHAQSEALSVRRSASGHAWITGSTSAAGTGAHSTGTPSSRVRSLRPLGKAVARAGARGSEQPAGDGEQGDGERHEAEDEHPASLGGLQQAVQVGRG